MVYILGENNRLALDVDGQDCGDMQKALFLSCMRFYFVFGTMSKVALPLPSTSLLPIRAVLQRQRQQHHNKYGG